MSLALRLAAWACLGVIAVATLSSVELRPVTGLPAHAERFAAFALVGALFAAAYPRHLPLVAALVLGAALLLEAMQLMVASRHGRLFDATVKLAGGGLGILAGAAWTALRRRLDGSGARGT